MIDGPAPVSFDAPAVLMVAAVTDFIDGQKHRYSLKVI